MNYTLLCNEGLVPRSCADVSCHWLAKLDIPESSRPGSSLLFFVLLPLCVQVCHVHHADVVKLVYCTSSYRDCCVTLHQISYMHIARWRDALLAVHGSSALV
jgi:hypothetical protein